MKKTINELLNEIERSNEMFERIENEINSTISTGDILKCNYGKETSLFIMIVKVEEGFYPLELNGEVWFSALGDKVMAGGFTSILEVLQYLNANSIVNLGNIKKLIHE